MRKMPVRAKSRFMVLTACALSTLLMCGCLTPGMVPEDDYYAKQKNKPAVSVARPQSETAGARRDKAQAKPSTQSSRPELAQGSIPSLPSPPSVDVEWEPSTNQQQRALIIGANTYGAFPNLENARSDAEAVSQALRTFYGFSDIREIYDEDVTERRILAEFERLVADTQPNDSILIFYAGHGIYSPTLGEGFWIPSDASGNEDFIDNSVIQKRIEALNDKKAGHVLLISDACFSGSFFGSKSRSIDNGRVRGVNVTAPVPLDKAHTEVSDWLDRLTQSPSRQAFTSGSLETVPDGGGGDHSVFTACLLNALTNPDYSAFTASELAQKVMRLVGNNSEQTPRFGTIRFVGDMAGEFVFRKEE